SLKSCLSFHSSTDQPLGTDEETTMVDMLTTDSIPLPDNQFDIANTKDHFTCVFSMLTDRESEILRYYFGINEFHQHYSLDEIGEKMNMTRERVRQLKDKSIRKIRKAVRGK